MNTKLDKTQFISVVEDELDIMTLFRDALSQLPDVEVFGFTNSPLALEHFKMNQSQYSLVLSDFRIPEIDGIQLLKEIKAIKPSVKTLLVSAFEVENELIQQCSCIDTFLQKPISVIDLIEEVEAIPQKWIFACSACGCIFTTMAEKQTGLCPVRKSSDMNKIEGFD